MDVHVKPMSRRQAPAVAALHRQSIRTGLIAWLGQRFCAQVYRGMARSPHSFVLVCEDENGRVLGFVCCATNTSRMYRSVVTRRFVPLTLTAIGKVLTHPSVVRDMWRALRRPRTFQGETYASWDLPEAEVVAIAVAPEAQGRRLGTRLLREGLTRLQALGCSRVCVWTSEDNEAATAFYQKRGFAFLGVRPHHSGGIRVFVTDLGNPSASAP